MVQTLGDLAQRTPKHAPMAAADKAVGGAVDVANQLAGLGSTTIPPSGLGYGTTGFDDRMSTLAWLIRSNLGVRVACLSFDDGFDFHDNQVNRQADCLSSLGQTLAAFPADLEAHGTPTGSHWSGASSASGSTTTTPAAAAPTSPAASRWSSART
jgi:uncharacterized protein (DUF1501 family)